MKSNVHLHTACVRAWPRHQASRRPPRRRQRPPPRRRSREAHPATGRRRRCLPARPRRTSGTAPPRERAPSGLPHARVSACASALIWAFVSSIWHHPRTQPITTHKATHASTYTRPREHREHAHMCPHANKQRGAGHGGRTLRERVPRGEREPRGLGGGKGAAPEHGVARPRASQRDGHARLACLLAELLLRARAGARACASASVYARTCVRRYGPRESGSVCEQVGARTCKQMRCALAAAWCRAKSGTHRTTPCAQRTHTRILRRTTTLARGRRMLPPLPASTRAHTLSPHPFLASCSATHAHSPGSVAMAKASPPASSSAASTSGPAASSGSPGSEHAPPRAPPARANARVRPRVVARVCARGGACVLEAKFAKAHMRAHAHTRTRMRTVYCAQLGERACVRERWVGCVERVHRPRELAAARSAGAGGSHALPPNLMCARGQGTRREREEHSASIRARMRERMHMRACQRACWRARAHAGARARAAAHVRPRTPLRPDPAPPAASRGPLRRAWRRRRRRLRSPRRARSAAPR